MQKYKLFWVSALIIGLLYASPWMNQNVLGDTKQTDGCVRTEWFSCLGGQKSGIECHRPLSWQGGVWTVGGDCYQRCLTLYPKCKNKWPASPQAQKHK